MTALLWPLAGPAKDLKAAFGQEKAPYLWVENGEIKGLEYDIVRAALAAAGYGLTASTLPNRRVNVAVSSGEFDFATGMQLNEAGLAFYSDVYLAYANYATTKKNRNIHLTELADIFKYKVAIWQNAWEDLNLEKFHPSGKVEPGSEYTEFPSAYRQVKFFWADRADINVADKNIFLWYTRILSEEMDTSAELVYHNILPQITVRAAFRDRKARDDFNAGLKKIHESGEYQKIFDKYALVDPRPNATP